MIQFIEDHRDDHGVEPICRVLPIAPATFYDHLAKRVDPSRLSDRAVRDTELKPEVERVFEDNLSVYGVRKVWHQMRREGFEMAITPPAVVTQVDEQGRELEPFESVFIDVDLEYVAGIVENLNNRKAILLDAVEQTDGR